MDYSYSDFGECTIVGMTCFVSLVEPMGFEPTTSSMPSRRAPNCATAPPGRLSDVSIRALASSMTVRQSVVVRASNVTVQSHEFSRSRKAFIYEKCKPNFVGQPTNSVCPCEYGVDLIEENNHFCLGSRK